MWGSAGPGVSAAALRFRLRPLRRPRPRCRSRRVRPSRRLTSARPQAVGGELVEEPEQLDRDRHDQRAVLFGGDLDHGLQQPQLQRGGVAGHHVGGRGEALRGLVFAVGGDDPGVALPLRLGLARHRPLTRCRAPSP
jgi:hypothetical protein